MRREIPMQKVRVCNAYWVDNPLRSERRFEIKNQSFMDSSSVDYYQRDWKQGVQKTMNLSRNPRKTCFQQLKCMDLKLSGMETPSATLLCQKPRKRAETNVELSWMVCWCLCGFSFLVFWNDEPRSKCRKCYVFLNTFETNFRTCAYDNFVLWCRMGTCQVNVYCTILTEHHAGMPSFSFVRFIILFRNHFFFSEIKNRPQRLQPICCFAIWHFG